MFHQYRFGSGSSARIVAAAALTAAFVIPITIPGVAVATGSELSAPIPHDEGPIVRRRWAVDESHVRVALRESFK
jgi:hypothetical protein